MHVFKTKGFARFARRQKIEDAVLCVAIARAMQGLIDADLGGGVIKQRIPRKGQGSSGGFRTIVLYRSGSRAVFVDGFAKNDRGNIDEDDLGLFKELASEFLAYSAAQANKMLTTGAWIRVNCDDDKT